MIDFIKWIFSLIENIILLSVLAGFIVIGFTVGSQELGPHHWWWTGGFIGIFILVIYMLYKQYRKLYG